MTFLRIILALGLGWLTYAGLRNIYYGEYLSGGVKLGFGLLLLALFAGVWLIRSGRRLNASDDTRRGRRRILFGSLTLLGMLLAGTFWLIFFVGGRLQYGPTQAPWLADLLAPRLSTRLAFASNGNIYVINGDGRRLLLSPSKQRGYFRPAWFPDSNRLLVGTRPDGQGDLYVLNADGSNLTPVENQSRYQDTPVDFDAVGSDSHVNQLRYWTLHEDPLFLASEEGGNMEIYVKKSENSEPVRLTHNDASDGFPHPLPDGSRIAFLSKRDGWAIYVIPAEGGPPMRVTREPNVGFFRWSPDGRQIAYVVSQNSFEHPCSVIACHEIYVANSDGSEQTRLTRSRASNTLPTWSPDGRHIAFLSYRDVANPMHDIYVMNADGNRQTRLTFDKGQFYIPVWAPN